MLWQSDALIVIVLFYLCSSCVISVCDVTLSHTRFTEQGIFHVDRVARNMLIVGI